MSLPPHKHPYTPWIIGIAVIGSFLFAVYHLSDVLTPFIVAAVLAYILNPLVCKIEKLGINRSRASMWVMLFAFFLIVALLLVIVPMLLQQLHLIIQRIPKLVDYVQTQALPWLNQKFDKHIVLDENTITAWLRANTSAIQGNLQKTLPAVMQSGGALASGLSNLILLPLLLYYFLLDWSHWEAGVRTMIPRRYLDGYNRIAGNMDTVLGEFLRGQLMVMLIMGILYGTGLMLTGLDSGFAIGMVAGILVFVPYLGAFTGLLLATLAAVLQFNTWGGLHHPKNCRRPHWPFSVLGYLLADGVRPAVRLCRHAHRPALGRHLPRPHSGRQIVLFEQPFLPARRIAQKQPALSFSAKIRYYRVNY